MSLVYIHTLSGIILCNNQITFLSMSLSHMSLIVQPAPRIITAPRANKPRISKFGNAPADDAKAILHEHGQYKSSHPKCQ